MPWKTNLVLLVTVETGYVGLLAAAAGIPIAHAVTLFFVGALGTAPTVALYLVLVAAIPPEWSQRRKRAVALALSPLMAGFFLSFGWHGGGGLLAVLLVATTLYGAIVRVPTSSSRVAAVQ